MMKKPGILAWAIVLSLVYYQVHRWAERKDTDIWAFITFLLLCLVFAFTVFGYFRKKGRLTNTAWLNLLLLTVSIVGTLLIAEILLRFFAADLQSYGERNGADVYHSSYDVDVQKCDSCGGGDYFINSPLGTGAFYKPEFHYLHRYNSLGLRDKEFNTQKKDNEFRILGLGDSFTEGVGTSADSTWLKQLEYLLNSSGKNVLFTTMNGGVHGSDLFFSYDLFIHCLQKYRPDLVILNLNSTDINDLVYRGCYERFDARGNFKSKGGPGWEFFFGSSFLVRLVALNVLHSDWQLLLPEQKIREEEQAIIEMGKKINDYQALAEKNRFAFLLVLQPLQMDLKDRPNPLLQIKFNPAIRHIDLAPVLEDSIHARQDNYALFYYPVDGHFTTRGYGLEAKTIFREYFAAKDSL